MEANKRKRVLSGYLAMVLVIETLEQCGCMQNGSLDGALRGQSTPGDRASPGLQWHQRTCLAASCADALSYQHLHAPRVNAARS